MAVQFPAFRYNARYFPFVLRYEDRNATTALWTLSNNRADRVYPHGTTGVFS
jgi:hypothetical protein